MVNKSPNSEGKEENTEEREMKQVTFDLPKKESKPAQKNERRVSPHKRVSTRGKIILKPLRHKAVQPDKSGPTKTREKIEISKSKPDEEVKVFKAKKTLAPLVQDEDDIRLEETKKVGRTTKLLEDKVVQ